jgi:hypothetical protein
MDGILQPIKEYLGLAEFEGVDLISPLNSIAELRFKEAGKLYIKFKDNYEYRSFVYMLSEYIARGTKCVTLNGFVSSKSGINFDVDKLYDNHEFILPNGGCFLKPRNFYDWSLREIFT